MTKEECETKLAGLSLLQHGSGKTVMPFNLWLYYYNQLYFMETGHHITEMIDFDEKEKAN